MIYKSLKRGSALLVAILVMGILMTLTLGLSSLVVREIRSTADIVAAGQAYYAAEAGIEQAIYELSTNLPGYQTQDSSGEVVWVESVPDPAPDIEIEYRYRIDNKGDAIPYFSGEQPIFTAPDVAVSKTDLYGLSSSSTYNRLGLNETVTIPLFTDDGTGNVQNVEDFVVQYYVNFPLKDEIEKAGYELRFFDMLRWKIFGNSTDPADTKTYAISDYYPVTEPSTPETPTCIGSDQSLLPGCNVPRITFGDADVGQVGPEDSIGGWSYARECYSSEVGEFLVIGQPSASGLSAQVRRNCGIPDFIENHTRNYITLTNAVNPEVVDISGTEEQIEERASIYYRIITNLQPSTEEEPKDLVRQNAQIRADGFARGGSVMQSVDASIGMSSSLPVFNFSLYRTDTGL